jgi:hypothetical protein
MVDDDRLMEEEAVGDGALPDDVADGSISKVLLHLQQKTAEWFIGLDDDGAGWWWRSTVSRGVGTSAKAE